MRAYNEVYVLDAQRRLGAMLDFGVNGCGRSLVDFYRAFLSSSVSIEFELGSPRIVAGKSGVELALDVLLLNTSDADQAADLPIVRTLQEYAPLNGASSEYWTGWALAFYQWSSGRSFQCIEDSVPISVVHRCYHPYHEMDISSFCQHMDDLCRGAKPKTRLRERREIAGLSQSELAAATGIPVRTIQQYEQRQKCIDNAQARYVLQLSRVLCCNPDSLLEHEDASYYRYYAMDLK